MPNPYQPTVFASTRDAVPSPTLDLDPSTGPEQEKSLPAAVTTTTEVPRGNMKEILDWVDGDKKKAADAIAAEKADEAPRPTLIDKLKKVIEA